MLPSDPVCVTEPQTSQEQALLSTDLRRPWTTSHTNESCIVQIICSHLFGCDGGLKTDLDQSELILFSLGFSLSACCTPSAGPREILTRFSITVAASTLYPTTNFVNHT